MRFEQIQRLQSMNTFFNTLFEIARKKLDFTLKNDYIKAKIKNNQITKTKKQTRIKENGKSMSDLLRGYFKIKSNDKKKQASKM